MGFQHFRLAASEGRRGWDIVRVKDGRIFAWTRYKDHAWELLRMLEDGAREAEDRPPKRRV